MARAANSTSTLSVSTQQEREKGIKLDDSSIELLREVTAAAARDPRCDVAAAATAARRQEQADLLSSVYEQLDEVRAATT